MRESEYVKTQIRFENKVPRDVVLRKVGSKLEFVKQFRVIPMVGEGLVIRGKMYKIVRYYARAGRFYAEVMPYNEIGSA